VASDHGHPTAATADLSRFEAEALFHKASRGAFSRPRQSGFAPICSCKWRV
jgi:glucuronate isomerase